VDRNWVQADIDSGEALTKSAVCLSGSVRARSRKRACPYRGPARGARRAEVRAALRTAGVCRQIFRAPLIGEAMPTVARCNGGGKTPVRRRGVPDLDPQLGQGAEVLCSRSEPRSHAIGPASRQGCSGDRTRRKPFIADSSCGRPTSRFSVGADLQAMLPCHGRWRESHRAEEKKLQDVLMRLKYAAGATISVSKRHGAWRRERTCAA